MSIPRCPEGRTQPPRLRVSGSIEAGSEKAGMSPGMVAKHREAPLPASSGAEWVSLGQLQEHGLCQLPHARQWQQQGLLLA